MFVLFVCTLFGGNGAGGDMQSIVHLTEVCAVMACFYANVCVFLLYQFLLVVLCVCVDLKDSLKQKFANISDTVCSLYIEVQCLCSFLSVVESCVCCLY